MLHYNTHHPLFSLQERCQAAVPNLSTSKCTGIEPIILYRLTLARGEGNCRSKYQGGRQVGESLPAGVFPICAGAVMSHPLRFLSPTAGRRCNTVTMAMEPRPQLTARGGRLQGRRKRWRPFSSARQRPSILFGVRAFFPSPFCSSIEPLPVRRLSYSFGVRRHPGVPEQQLPASSVSSGHAPPHQFKNILMNIIAVHTFWVLFHFF